MSTDRATPGLVVTVSTLATRPGRFVLALFPVGKAADPDVLTTPCAVKPCRSTAPRVGGSRSALRLRGTGFGRHVALRRTVVLRGRRLRADPEVSGQHEGRNQPRDADRREGDH